jgi:ABC-type Mn2+/Zn2+ transport system ATPase subunit
VTAIAARHRSGTGDVLVSLHSASKRFGDVEALRDITLDIHDGDFIGLVGPSGSGKTTLLTLLLGSASPSDGSLRRATDCTIGYVPQLDTIDWTFPVTVFDVVVMALQPNRLRPWAGRCERRQVNAILDRLGLDGLGGRHIRDLSGGQQQRMFLARALVSSPTLCLLDEPTSGLDAATRHEILHLLDELNGQGHTIVLTTHDLNGVASHLPELVCLRQSIVAQGSPNQVLTPATLEATYGVPMWVLEHAGVPVVVDRPGPDVALDLRTTTGANDRSVAVRGGVA